MNVLLILAIWMTSSAASPAPPQSTVLGVGSPVDRSIAAGDSHTFDLRLDAGQTALVEIEEDGIDVDLKVTEPSGDTIAQVIDLFGGQGRGQMVVAADTAGPFVLTVSARRWPIASGSYTLRLTGVRPSTRERSRAVAGDAAAVGDRARRRGRKPRAWRPRGRPRPWRSSSAERAFPTAIWRSSSSTSRALYHTGAERQKAWPLYERSLSLLERSVGPDHPRVARVLSSTRRDPDRRWRLRAGRRDDPSSARDPGKGARSGGSRAGPDPSGLRIPARETWRPDEGGGNRPSRAGDPREGRGTNAAPGR